MSKIHTNNKLSKKDDKKEIQPKLFTVVLEISSPTIIKHRVWAKTPEEAAEMVQKNPFASTIIEKKPIYNKLIKLKVTVYKAGSTIIEFIKNLK